MAASVSDHILEVLCENQGSLELQQLKSLLPVDETFLQRALLDDRRFHVVDEEPAERALSTGAVVVASSALRVCKEPGSCARCEELHLCRYLVCGECRFRTTCRNSHDLKSEHNSVLLRQNNLDFLQESQLFQLLLQNDPSLLPEICLHCNKGIGEHGRCQFQAKCKSLHICQYYLQDNCKYGATCQRAHHFENAKKILNFRGFSAKNIFTLQKTYKNKFLLTDKSVKSTSQGAEKVTQVKKQPSSSSVSEAGRNEICLYFLFKECHFKENCVRVHHDVPYKWEILDADGVAWTHFRNEEDVERAYCNPDNDTSFGLPPVDFSSMKCGGRKVRRLSTASSVTKLQHYILTTEWLWYWKNDQGQWIEYGLGEDNKRLTSIGSKDLEKVYTSEIPLTLCGNYVLSKTGMYLQDTTYKTQHEVRRRPRFVSAEDVKRKSKSGASETTNAPSEGVPAKGDKSALLPYTLVLLSGSEPDYKDVTTSFQRTMSSSTIHSVKRVQNPRLREVFQCQKEQMQERNEEKDICERLLFHGTDKSKIENICEENFDRRICGAQGSLYGKGCYFARDAIYSDRYAKSKSSIRMIFAARVLVGEFTKGSSSYVRPPPNPQKGGYYDSCVDNTSNPSIFVIFEKDQIYPEYIIEYSEDPLSS